MTNERAFRDRLSRTIPSGLIVALTLASGMLATDAQATNHLPYGPYTCKQGFVWREAVPGDHVCVQHGPRLPDIRKATADENAEGPSHREPGGGAYGPDTCRPGFVWRETRPSDHVCVRPSSRERARVHNESAPFGLVSPDATPNNNIFVGEEIVNRQARLWVTGSFSPNKPVAFYAYDRNLVRGDRGLVLIAKWTADANGQLLGNRYPSPGTRFFQTGCTVDYYNRRIVPIIVVDEGSGIVSKAGETTAPWCRG